MGPGNLLRRKWVWWVVAGVVCFFVLAPIPSGVFNSVSVCTTCGAEQNAEAWHLPLTSIIYRRTSSVRETPLSLALARAGLADSHAHAWVLVHGSGNGIGCDLGIGSDITEAVRSPEVGAFVEAVARYQGRASAQAWVDRLLDWKQSPKAVKQILLVNPPLAGFLGQADFEQWWRGHAETLAPEPAAGGAAGTAASRP